MRLGRGRGGGWLIWGGLGDIKRKDGGLFLKESRVKNMDGVSKSNDGLGYHKFPNNINIFYVIEKPKTGAWVETLFMIAAPQM